VPHSEIEKLRHELNSLELTGKSVVSFRALPVMEKAFFPGGYGLLRGRSDDLPVNGTIVFGSNFGCVADYLNEDGTLRRQDETLTSSTWKGLYRMLDARTGIDLERCFFTNAWPFLHKGQSNETKGLISAWFADEALMKKCLYIFERTLSVIRPTLVIALGTGASAFLSRTWPEKLGIWNAMSIASLDKLPFEQVEFENRRITCTAITHPSHSNSWRRKPPFQGTHGEISLLQQAACEAGAKRC
jgi:hypothetical protein